MLGRIEYGDPHNPSLVFLHGFLGCKEDWEPLIHHCADKYHCIALDLPGHGVSPYCDDILSTLKDNLVSKPTLIGYSMGGRLALQLRDQATAVVNIAGHPGLKTQTEKEQRLLIDTQWSEKLQNLAFEDFLKQWYAQPLFGEHAEQLLEKRKNQNPQNLFRVLLQLSLAHQLLIEDFPCHTLFICGEKDTKYHTLFKKLEDRVCVNVVRNSAHAVHIEQPFLCATSILNWLNTHANTARAT